MYICLYEHHEAAEAAREYILSVRSHHLWKCCAEHVVVVLERCGSCMSFSHALQKHMRDALGRSLKIEIWGCDVSGNLS